MIGSFRGRLFLVSALSLFGMFGVKKLFARSGKPSSKISPTKHRKWLMSLGTIEPDRRFYRFDLYDDI